MEGMQGCKWFCATMLLPMLVCVLVLSLTSQPSVAHVTTMLPPEGTYPNNPNKFTQIAFTPGGDEIVAYTAWVNGVGKVFVRNVTTATLIPFPITPNQDCYVSCISQYGSYVVFYSLASNLIQPDNNDYYDVFVWAWNLPTSDPNWLRKASVYSNGNPAGGISYSYGVSSFLDGSGNEVLDKVCFKMKWLQLDPYVQNGYTGSFFVRDFVSGTTKCVDCGPTVGGYTPILFAEDAHLSPGGEYVALTVLCGDEVPGYTDQNGDIEEVVVHTISTYENIGISVVSPYTFSSGRSYMPSIDRAGRYVVFSSDGWDFDQEDYDSYDDIFLCDRDGDNDGIFEGPDDLVIRRLTNGIGEDGDIPAETPYWWPTITPSGNYIAFRPLYGGNFAGYSTLVHVMRLSDGNVDPTTAPGLEVRGQGCVAEYDGDLYLGFYGMPDAYTPDRVFVSQITWDCDITDAITITTNPATTSPLYTPVTISANAIAGVEYEFRVGYWDYYSGNFVWDTIQAYSTANTCIWYPWQANYYKIAVRLRAPGHTDPYCKAAWIEYTVTN